MPRANSKKKTWSAPPEEGGGVWSRVLWIVGATALAFVAASLISFDAADPPTHAVAPVNETVANWCGPVGAHVAWWSVRTLGIGAWVLVGGAGLGLGLAAAGRAPSHAALRGLGIVMIAAAVSGFHALLWPGASWAPEGGGGLVGITGAHELSSRFGTLGSGLWIGLVALVGATVAFDWLVVTVPAAVWGAVRDVVAPRAAGAAALAARRSGESVAAWRERREEAKRVRLTDIDGDEELEATTARMSALETVASGTKGGKKGKKKVAAVAEEDDGAWEDEGAEGEWDEEEWDEEDAEGAYDEEGDETEEELDEELMPGAPQVYSPEQLEAKIASLPVKFASQSRRSATDADLEGWQSGAELEGYQFPALDILEEPEESFSERQEEHVREQARRLEEALAEYRIQGEVVGIESGPVVTLFDVRLAPGTKVAQLSAVSSDLARSLRAVNIRIVPNMAGRDTVGIEAPNAEKEKVRLKELMSVGDKASRMHLPMFLGKDASGEPLIEDLASLPHMLIAGTTGSGKSVCMNTIIMSFLYTKKPNELKLVLIDPKMVELSMFRDIPHLMCPVVTEMGKATAILEWAVQKMDERYELLVEAGVRDIAGYNALEWEELRERFDPKTEAEEARIPRKLPFIVFMIDELADLMMTNKEVEGSIVRIAQKARAVGMHLVVATQRPQANVVTGLIKSNLPGRIAFKVASGMDSRIVLDQKGAELLLGQGDMLFLSPRQHKLERCQGTLVEDKEARKVVRFLKDVAAPSFDRQLVQLRSSGSAEGAGEEAETQGLQNALEDPLFPKAVEVVLETKRGSVSLLQRRLAIGYTRASRLIDLMGQAGIIGDYKGTVARAVTITPETWEEIKSRLVETEDGGARLVDEPVEGGETRETFGWESGNDGAGAEEGSAVAAAPAVGPDSSAESAVEAEADVEEDGEEEDDEGEVEYEYVDEDGNPVDPEDVEDEEWDEEDGDGEWEYEEEDEDGDGDGEGEEYEEEDADEEVEGTLEVETPPFKPSAMKK